MKKKHWQKSIAKKVLYKEAALDKAANNIKYSALYTTALKYADNHD